MLSLFSKPSLLENTLPSFLFSDFNYPVQTSNSFCSYEILDLDPSEFELVKTDLEYGYRLTLKKKNGDVIRYWSLSNSYTYSANYVDGVLLLKFSRGASKNNEKPVDVKIL